MHFLLEQIFENRTYINSRKEIIQVHSETSKEQCAFLQKIIKQEKFKSSIEIGLAYGTSTLAITEAVFANAGKHLTIDKFQQSHWGNNGLDLMDQSGLSESFEFREEYSYKILPELLNADRRFDFAYIDSTKLLDYLMTDFFFLDKLFEVGGVIVFDDVTFPGIRKLLRYLSQLPHYKVYDQFPENWGSPHPGTLAGWLKRFESSAGILKREIVHTDEQLQINAHCVALQKIAGDNRPYDWSIEF